MDNKSIRIKNLKRLKKENDVSYYKIAGMAETWPSHISQCITGAKNIGDGMARRIEKAFNKPLGWLDQLPANLLDSRDSIPKYPIINIGGVKSWLSNPILREDHMTIQFDINDYPNVGPYSFFLSVTGNAMVDKNNYEKSIGSGDVALIDPDLPTLAIKDGDLVLVETAPDDIKIREIKEDGAEKFLYAYDPTIPPIRLSSEMVILGAVIFTFKKMRRK